MKRSFHNSIYYHRRPSKFSTPKSKRPHRQLLEEAARLRKRVVVMSLLVLATFLVYIFLYSKHFKFQDLNIITSEETDYEEAVAIKKILDGNLFWVLPQDNYFLLNKKNLEKKFQDQFSLKDLKIKKRFPRGLTVEVMEKLGQALWISNERVFISDPEGKIVREVPGGSLRDAKMPIIYDLSDTEVKVGAKVSNARIFDLIFSLYSQFADYQLPVVELDYFKIDNQQANYVKLVTKQGFEIHFNTILSLEKQVYKLKKSLEAGKIDLNKILYINLRVTDQVIYK